MKQPKVIHDLFLFEDDLFRNEAEIFRNGRCTGIGQNTFASTSGASEKVPPSSSKHRSPPLAQFRSVGPSYSYYFKLMLLFLRLLSVSLDQPDCPSLAWSLMDLDSHEKGSVSILIRVPECDVGQVARQSCRFKRNSSILFVRQTILRPRNKPLLMCK